MNNTIEIIECAHEFNTVGFNGCEIPAGQCIHCGVNLSYIMNHKDLDNKMTDRNILLKK